MFVARTRQAVAECVCRLRGRGLWCAVSCLGIVLVLTAYGKSAERASSSDRNDGRRGARAAVKTSLQDGSFAELQSGQRSPYETATGHKKKPRPTPTPTEPAPEPEPVPIRHGIEVGPTTVGLSGAGVSVDRLRVVVGGRASALANAKDPETGRPMLSQLDIAGQLTIDVPCVIDRCRVRQAGGLYAVRNSSQLDFEARNCDFEAVMTADGALASCVVLYPRTLRRCIVKGGEDGIKLPTYGGCLIEDSWIYGQIPGPDSHNDCIQAVKGGADWDTWMIRRCRIEGPWQAQTSALLLQAESGNLSGVTIRECLLSGGTYTLYTRAKNGYVISKVRIVGNIWADKSWKFGAHSSDCREFDWSDNWFAPVSSATSPVAVQTSSARSYAH